MTDVTTSTRFRQGSFSTAEVRAVIVHDGRRGDEGPPGEGEKGDPGDSFVSRGPWVSGTIYCPLDAVTSVSSVDASVTNLFIQKSSAPCAVSVALPKDDPARWDEIGTTEFGDTFGNIWEVNQQGHNFTEIGQPVAWDRSTNLYVDANNSSEQELPVAVVREILDADNFRLQSSGLIRNVDPLVNADDVFWNDGGIYYQTLSGKVTETKPVGLVVQVFKIIDDTDAIVFPHLIEPTDPPDPAPAPATSHIKLDDIANGFNGVDTTFPLTAGGAVPWPASTESFRIYIDGNPQEALVDFLIVEDTGTASIQFTEAPQDFQNFWGIYAT